MANKKIKLRVDVINVLHEELSGSEIKGTKGLLNQKLPFVTKFHLTFLAKQVAEIFNTSEPLRVKLISELGTVNEQSGTAMVPQFITDENNKPVVNPNHQKFWEEWNKIASVEKELEYYPFKLEEFAGVQSDESFFVFFELLSNSSKEEKPVESATPAEAPAMEVVKD